MITLHSLYTLIQMNNGVFDKVEAKKRRTTPQEAVQNMKDILNKKKSFIKDAVYREDIGEISFFWGDNKAGVKHILHERQIKDKLSYKEACKVAIEVAKVIPNGYVTDEERNGSIRKVIALGDYAAILILGNKKNIAEKMNSWLLTGYKMNEKKKEKYNKKIDDNNS